MLTLVSCGVALLLHPMASSPTPPALRRAGTPRASSDAPYNALRHLAGTDPTLETAVEDFIAEEVPTAPGQESGTNYNTYDAIRAQLAASR